MTPQQMPVPWWRVGTAWFGIGALGAVVIGSFALLFTAVRDADALLPQTAARAAVANAPTTPAMQARNHSATPARQPHREPR